MIPNETPVLIPSERIALRAAEAAKLIGIGPGGCRVRVGWGGRSYGMRQSFERGLRRGVRNVDGGKP